MKERYKGTLEFTPVAQWVSAFIMGLMCLVIIGPILLLLLYSILPTGVINNLRGLSDIAINASFNGYMDVFRQTPFLTAVFNSLWLACVQTGAQLIVAFCAAYALTRWRFPGAHYILSLIVAAMIIPSVSVMIPNYMTISRMGFVNTFAGVLLPSVCSAYGIFLMRQFFLTVPRSLTEAAIIDGCGEVRILTRIYVPMSIPAVVALMIILFVGHWNDYHWPLLVLQSDKLMTVPLVIVRFRNEGVIDWMPTAAACIMAILPALLLYIFMQKQIVETFASSATKG